MKCERCKRELGKTFLGKILGTVVKDEKGKQHFFCSECQGQVKGEKQLLQQ